ncbi:Uu.00g052360.m01.CDS01 [Anthostomella pinea]|uniref:Uu.00g052360.m01.CDS01 n=1 Tax=Anthostomella pinea TaxID=933095 RepID=A0AAI8VQJ1_9PEZI|nr:Uu.00g052360.m01.CDS01 [Anthostomella pinea]
MVRTLPWKRRERLLQETSGPGRSTSGRQPKPKDQGLDDDKDSTIASASRKGGTRPTLRSTSTSPPPQPLQESYMIDGPDDDDRYRMVEDEFLATAQLFTAHMHAAEYQRLKAASRSENAETIRDISRPVVGRMTDLVRKKQERKARMANQKLATGKVLAAQGRSDGNGGSSEDDDSPRNESLYGLMESPKKQATRLDGLMPTTMATRAAAGFTRPRTIIAPTTAQPTFGQLPGSRPRPEPKSEDPELDDDDLEDASTSRTVRPFRAAVQSKPQPQRSQPLHSVAGQKQALRPAVKDARSTELATSCKATGESDSSDDDGLDFVSRLKKQQEERRHSWEQRKPAAKAKPKASSADIVPGFL